MFDVLAIDWGEKRTGIAFGDSETQLVIPYQNEVYTDNLSKILDTEITRRRIQTIVVGIPTTFHLQSTIVTEQISSFVELLRSQYPNLTIITYNERGTTAEAKKLISSKQGDKHTINHLAANQMLTHYFRFAQQK